MYAVLRTGNGLGGYRVTDHMHDTLFTVSTALSGRAMLYWSNWSSGTSGVAHTLEEALAGGLRSGGMDEELAAREAAAMIADFLATDWEITEDTGGDPDWPVTLRRLSRGEWAVVDRYRTKEDAELYIEIVTHVAA